MTLIRLGILMVGAVMIFKFVLLPIRVNRESMHPNYQDGQVKFINRLAYLFREPQRGDVVGLWKAGRRVMLLKRIIGLPGEMVRIRAGVVYINETELDEPYLIMEPHPWFCAPVRLGPDEFYVIGDNRSMPQDSHSFGIQKRERVAGKILR